MLKSRTVITYIMVVFYFLGLLLLKWKGVFTFQMIPFAIGAVIGFILPDLITRVGDTRREYISNIVIQAVLTVFALFLLTSSKDVMGQGAILSINLRYLLAQHKLLKDQAAVESWFLGSAAFFRKNPRKIAVYLIGVWMIFIIETLLFL